MCFLCVFPKGGELFVCVFCVFFSNKKVLCGACSFGKTERICLFQHVFPL